METITVVLIVFAVVNFVCITAFLFIMERRSTARLAAAHERERELTATLALERIVRAEENATYAERLAAANARERLIAEQFESNNAVDAPVALAGVAERAATLILRELPMGAREREKMAACAALGGLMTAHHYIGAALNEMLKKADLTGDIFHLRYDDSANDEIVDDEDDPDSDPGNVQ
jgi:hypothetical protein